MKHLYIYLLTLCIIMATACTMNESGNINSEKTLEPTLTSDYNVQMNDIAIAVSNAMRASNDFRTLVKDEALRKFDFAYDIMLRPLSKKRLSDIGSTRAAMGEATVGDVLNDFFPSDTKSTGIDIIDSLCAAYPLLQISVPVHLEDWNPDTYTPTVVFVGDDFSERTSLTVGGYDAEGNYVTVDAVNEPDVPVIVIGLNERGGDSLGVSS